MKKKLLMVLLFTFTLGGVNSVFAAPVVLHVDYVDPLPGIPGQSKDPTILPVVSLDGNVLTFESAHEDFTLCLFDEENNEVYSVFVPSSVSVVVLPATLTGNFKLMLVADTYYYYGYISL